MTDSRVADGDSKREAWERDQRGYAEYMMRMGHNPRDRSDLPSFTDEELAEVLALEEAATTQIEEAWWSIRDYLLREHDEAAHLWARFRGIPQGDHDAAIEALQPPARDAFKVLMSFAGLTRLIRDGGVFESCRVINERLSHGPSSNGWWWYGSWPDRFEHPDSPELQRLRTLNEDAVARHRTDIRERGRHRLAAIENGEAWADFLDGTWQAAT